MKSLLAMVLGLFTLSCSVNDEQVAPDVSTATNGRAISKKEGVRSQAKSLLNVGLPGNAEQGVMLHTHSWPFKSIAAAIPGIAMEGKQLIYILIFNASMVLMV